MENYDIIIIGSGPAGLTAAIYAARREMKTLVLGKELGGQVMWASEIENYPGFQKIDNYDLISRMQQQVTNLGVEIKTEDVRKIEPTQDHGFAINTTQASYYAKTTVLSIGLSPRRLAIPGEQEFQGKGVSYCANCDGPFYKGKRVVVVGGGNSALDAAEVLSKIASHVSLVHRRDTFRAFEALVDEVKSKSNVELHLNSEVKRIKGQAGVETVQITNNQTGDEVELEAEGVFVEIGRIANTDLVKDVVELDDKGQIIVDDYCQTSCPGVFAAGDVTQVPFKQISVACGQGTIAALAAYQYLQTGQSSTDPKARTAH